MALTKSKPFNNGSRLEEMQSIFYPLVKPGFEEKFENEWKKWIVLSDKIEELKKPGKLKPEFQSSNCEMIALSPKNYFAIDFESKNVKQGMKGIPQWTKTTLEEYRNTLYDNKDHYCIVNSLRLDADKKMTRTSLVKRGLSQIHVKNRIHSDKILCHPLIDKEGNYL